MRDAKKCEEVIMELHVGDKLQDGSIAIRDEDRLCYQVLSASRGATGVRTISKALLAEWVDAVKNDPQAQGGELREKLCGKTEIDKFEYGYFATLKKMADMVLGNVPVIHAAPDFSAEFCRWFAANRGKGSDGTARKYLSYFKTLTDAYQEPTHSYWHGLYKVMYGHDAEKEVATIGGIGEFERIYGGILSALEKKIVGEDMDAEGCQKAIAWFWQPEVKPHTCVTSALNAYRDFLKWREGQKSLDYDALCKAGVQFWTHSPGEQAKEWDAVKKDGVIALNFHEVGDFSKLGDKDAVVAAFQAVAGDEASHKNAATAVIDFRDVMKPGDYVFAKKGMSTYIGVGKVTGEFFYDTATTSEFRNRRKIDWFKVETHELADNKAARKTLTNITDCREFVNKLLAAFGLTGELPIEEPAAIGDRLSVALRMFKERRNDPEWAFPPDKPDWGYVSVNKGTREYYAKLKADIANLDEKKVREMFLGVGYETKNITFKPMWSGSNGTGWDSIKKGLEDETHGAKTIERIKRYAASADDVLVFATKEDDKDRPSGFGKSVESELLMKFHPDAAIKCGTKTIKVLKKLNLMSFKRDDTYDEWEYRQVLGIATDIKLRMDKLGITRTLEDSEKADYITVNEFIAWCNENEDLIKEEVMKNEFKPAESTPKPGNRTLKDAVQNDEMMQRLMSALRTKPFAILAGHSGTGKSQLVRRLAYMTCNDEVLAKETEKFNAPGNYCMVQVKPNWHDSTDLLGYYTEMGGGHYHTTEFVEFICKAYAYPNTPFFVCLDEMNLAPVEQYFAEFLSAIESYSEKTGLTDSLINENAPAEEVCGRTKLSESYDHVKEHKLTIPRNLFVVGTVNVDETTCQFSRKVLDRAMTLLMTTARFESMTKVNDPSDEELIDPDGIAFFLERPTQATLVQGQMEWLAKVQQQVGDTAFAIAYRFANECALYQAAYQKLMGMKENADDVNAQKTAIDHTVLMKLLPRIHGTRAEVEAIFKGRESDPKKDGLIKALGEGQSADMMTKILERGGDYISFWP